MGKERIPTQRVAGVKQSKRAILEGKARLVYVAKDADPALTEPVAALCRESGIALEEDRTMAQLGQACGLAVGAAVVAVLK